MRAIGSPPGQRGASLLFTLVALAVLGFAAAALAFTVQAGSQAMANLGTRQAALHAGATATEQAVAWLQAHAGTGVLDADVPAEGYRAASPARLDVTGTRTSPSDRWSVIDWDGQCLGLAAGDYLDCAITPRAGSAVAGQPVQYVIVRLCSAPGDAIGAGCLRGSAATSGTGTATDAAGPYYQVLVRVGGARGSVAYTESLVRFTDRSDPASLRRTAWRELVD